MIQFYGTTNPSDTDLSSVYYFKYSFLMLPYYECPKDYPIYLISSDKCSNGCSSGSYYDPNSFKCEPCSDLCLTCDRFDQCFSCKSSQNRIFVDYKCLPMDGYYESNTLIAAPCTSPCVHCSQSATNCTKCNGYDRALKNFKCPLCGDIFHECKNCTSNECVSCAPDHFLLNQTFCKHQC